MKAIVTVCVLFFTTVHCQYAPFIEACKSKDRSCLVRSAQAALPVVAAGVPALGLRSLDPMRVPLVDASQGGLNISFTDSTVKGLRNCRILDLERKSKLETSMTLSCHVEMVGHYSLGGKLIIFPIEGQGRYKIKLREIRVKVDLQLGERAADGERYWTVDSFTNSVTAPQPVRYHFQNLFNGNKQASDTVHQYANTNWELIFKQVAPPIVDSIVAQIIGEVSKLFDQVPVSQLALD
ncbi:protein takeout-like [Bicyclus anynana]|uniref:Protein takeout-like n=1 Tax=Bicyclus anynana TaxID=110368 RepID=A0A6J1MYJ8_BICAN|nr:protein takeout-like [Bicyclus anynana]